MRSPVPETRPGQETKPALGRKELLEQMVRLRYVGHLFEASAQLRLVPFSWSGQGLEAVVVGAVSALEEREIVHADPRTHAVALVREMPVEECVRQLLSPHRETHSVGKLEYEALFPPISPSPRPPGLWQWPRGRVAPMTSELGHRVHQALGSAWAAKNEGDQHRAALCFLGPSELERPEALDCLQRAARLRAPLVVVAMDSPQNLSTWAKLLDGAGIATGRADEEAVVELAITARALLNEARRRLAPAVLLAPRKPGAEPVEMLLGQMRSDKLLDGPGWEALRGRARQEVGDAVKRVLGPGRALPLLVKLDRLAGASLFYSS